MRYTVGIGRYFDIPVKVHFTFPLILFVFGVEAWINESPAAAAEAVMLVLAAFVCVILHEFGHSLQVKRYGITVRDIVLLPIGGMARAEKIPENPWQEIVVAISGPLVNFAIAGLLWLVILLRDVPLASEGNFIVNLFFINMVLGLFNLVPAFPMDGGRILRGLLALRLPYLRATRYAKSIGQIIAVLFVVVGFAGSFVMLPVIAVFIFFGAGSEEHQIRVRSLLADRSLGELVDVSDRPIADTTTASAAMDLLAGRNRRAHAVTDVFRAATGVVTREDLQASVKNGRGDEAISPLVKFDLAILPADMAADQAYYYLKGQRKPFVGVVDGPDFLGIIETSSFLTG